MFYGNLVVTGFTDEVLQNNESYIKNLLIRAEEFCLESEFADEDEYNEYKSVYAAVKILYENLGEVDKESDLFIEIVSLINVYQTCESLVRKGLFRRVGNAYQPIE